MIGVDELRRRFGTATGPARLAVLSCEVAGDDSRGLAGRAGEAVIETGTVTAGTLLFGAGA